MKEYEFFCFTINKDERVACIENVSQRVEKYYNLRKCIKMGDDFPPTTILDVHEDSGDMLTDFIDNISRAIIISSKVREVFEEEGVGENKIEYLPFVLHDKKGRVVKTQYYIANILVKTECFDYENSEYKTYPENPLKILSLRKLFVVKDKIPENVKLFRLAEDPRFVIIRSDLLARLREEQVTGISVLAMGEKL